ncbi:MAG: J domain-containing protein [Timaviella obliquedivisa GSE-PSE-MK23-08B]|jgi:curved DNA-binding protein CbpA|nr:J domain-containing protein [Timaviella obliquedivisa GSE-PSE-MK23-08B]
MSQAKQPLTYYDLLGLHPSASVQQIRRAYRERSKLYHPDTTVLQAAIATAKFHELNEAYGTLSSPDRRSQYDRKIGYSRVPFVQPLPNLYDPPTPRTSKPYRSSAYLDPSDRPLSPGEIFALFIMGATLIGCLLLVLIVGVARGEIAL